MYVTQDPSPLGEILRELFLGEILRGLFELEGKVNFSVSTLRAEVSNKKLSLPYITPT